MVERGMLKRLVRETIEPRLHKIGLSVQIPTPYEDLVETMSLFERSRDVTMIRLGGENDGGYWVPECISNLDALLSPGVNGLWKFEEDLLERFGVTSYLLDKGDAISGAPFQTLDTYVGSHTNQDQISMDRWVEDLGLGDSNKLGLQMDIEGSEYPTILAMSESLMSSMEMMVIEFHWLDQIINKRFNSLLVRPTIEKILNTHDVIYAQLNPVVRYSRIRDVVLPMAMEVTFLRRDSN
jgi:hypothetical protein